MSKALTPAAITLPPAPTGLWGVVVRFIAHKLLLPAARLLLDELEDWADGDDDDDDPPPTEPVQVPVVRPRKRLFRGKRKA